MSFSIKKCFLYRSLQKIVNIVSSRPRLPILSHVLLEIDKNYLFMTATNLEMEIIAKVDLDKSYPLQSMTVSAKKFLEICHNLPDQSNIMIMFKNNKVTIESECSNFCLSSLPIADFPKSDRWKCDQDHITILQSDLKKMIKLTQFSMGYQDTRFYLNGMFFETKDCTIRMVSTDGYRLSMCELVVDVQLPFKSIIIPRKGVYEISHLLDSNAESAYIQVYDNIMYISVNNYIFSTKLIDATFPDYHSVFLNKSENICEIERIVFKDALKRASILSNEKLRIINLHLIPDQLKIITYNFEQERSEEVLKILYSGKNIDIAFNVDYLLDIVSTVDSPILRFTLIDSVSSVQVEGVPKNYGSTYIIMPVKI